MSSIVSSSYHAITQFQRPTGFLGDCFVPEAPRKFKPTTTESDSSPSSCSSHAEIQYGRPTGWLSESPLSSSRERCPSMTLKAADSWITHPAKLNLQNSKCHRFSRRSSLLNVAKQWPSQGYHVKGLLSPPAENVGDDSTAELTLSDHSSLHSHTSRGSSHNASDDVEVHVCNETEGDDGDW